MLAMLPPRFKANFRENVPSVTPLPPENPLCSSSASSLRIRPRRRPKTTPIVLARQSISIIPRQLSRFLLSPFLNRSLSRKSTHSGTMPYSSTSSGGTALTSEAVAVAGVVGLGLKATPHGKRRCTLSRGRLWAGPHYEPSLCAPYTADLRADFDFTESSPEARRKQFEAV